MQPYPIELMGKDATNPVESCMRYRCGNLHKNMSWNNGSTDKWTSKNYNNFLPIFVVQGYI